MAIIKIRIRVLNSLWSFTGEKHGRMSTLFTWGFNISFEFSGIRMEYGNKRHDTIQRDLDWLPRAMTLVPLSVTNCIISHKWKI